MAHSTKLYIFNTIYL